MSQLIAFGLLLAVLSTLWVTYGVDYVCAKAHTIDIDEFLKYQALLKRIKKSKKRLSVPCCYAPQYHFVWPLGLPIQNHRYEKPEGYTEREAVEIRNVVFERSNYYRKRHGLKPFAFNLNLQHSAQAFCNNLARSSVMEHTPDDERMYGESAYRTNLDIKNFGKDAVDTWYMEMAFVREKMTEEDFLPDAHTAFKGHMTALLWIPTNQTGTGVSRGVDNYRYICAHYYPPGNVYHHHLEFLPPFNEKHIREAQRQLRKHNEEDISLYFHH